MDPLFLAGAALVAALAKHKRDADAYAKRRDAEQREFDAKLAWLKKQNGM